MASSLETPEAADRSLQEQKRELRRYWDTHPISTDSVPYEPGTRESFEAIYANWKKGINALRLTFLEFCRGKQVLEVGCGIGKDARFLTENGIRYFGIDYSYRTLQLAHKHFDYNSLPKRFTNADACHLPFADDSFDLVMSIGVIHHIPGTPQACREVVRVTRPGGSIRVMFYSSNSYHYFLVNSVVRPLIWVMLHLPFLEVFLRFAPEKFRHMYLISKKHGFNSQRILNISADTSFPGDSHFITHSGFYNEKEMLALFPGLEDYRFFRRDLKYWPFPFFRSFFEKRWGFFLTMTAHKPASSNGRSSIPSDVPTNR